MKKRVFTKWFLVLVGIGFFSISILGGTPAAAAKQPIRIGVTTDFSGVTATWGVKEGEVYKMVRDEVNKAGGINGRPIDLTILNNGGDPAKILANLKLLKQKHGCVAMLVGVHTTNNLVAKKWAEENQIPMITPDPMSDRLIVKERKAWWFRTQVPNSVGLEVTLRRAKELGYKKIGFEGSTLAFGRDALNGIQKMAPEYGLDFVGSVLCEPKSRDLSIQAKKLRDTGATAVITAEYENETGVFARGMKTIGWSPYVISIAGSSIAEVLKSAVATLIEGWETMQLIDVTKPLCREIWDKYEAYTGKRFEGEQPPRNWDAIQLLLEAVRLGGNPDDPAAIRNGFYKIKNFPIAIGRKNTMGSFEIGRNHLLEAKDVPVYVVKSGKMIPVE